MAKSFEYPEVFARFYDLIYHQLRDEVDSQFFLSRLSSTSGPVLEVGVGTGRFFSQALSQGADIYGFDISPSMIEVLKNKIDPAAHSRVGVQNATSFSYPFKFKLIVAPFRVFMHLLSIEDQLMFLNNAYQHLEPGGRLIFDTFVPDLNQLIAGLDRKCDFDQEYEPGLRVRRIVSTKPDLINQLISITFRFEWDDSAGPKELEWQLPLRFFFRFELEHLLERSHFKDFVILGDYHGGQLTASSKEFIVECRKGIA